MTVAMLPRSPLYRDNPYLNILEGALRRHGLAIIDDPNDHLSWRWLLRQRRRVDVLHFHWLQHHYDRASPGESVVALAKFAAKMLQAKALGYRLVWTVHNFRPHEPRYPRLDRACAQLLARVAHHVIVHCDAARRELAERHGRRHHVSVVSHPNYIGVYPPAPDRAEARRQLGLAAAGLVYLAVGGVRPYKGLHQAIVAFRALSDRTARFVIAGWPLDQRIAAEICALARGDDRIVTVLQFIPAAELPTYLAAADVVVLSFRNVTTSGSALLAMSMARPVVAPAMGCLPELVAPSAGILYEAEGSGALSEALRRCREVDLDAMGRAAYDIVARHTPDEVARRHIEVYAAGT